MFVKDCLFFNPIAMHLINQSNYKTKRNKQETNRKKNRKYDLMSGNKFLESNKTINSLYTYYCSFGLGTIF